MCSTSHNLYIQNLESPQFFEFAGARILTNLCQNTLNFFPKI